MAHNSTNNHPPEEHPREVVTSHGVLIHTDSLLPYWPDDSTFSINLLRHRTTGQPWIEIEWEGHSQDEAIHIPLDIAPTVQDFEDLPAFGYATPRLGREVNH